MKTFRLLRGSFFVLALTFLVATASTSPIVVLPAGSVWRYRADGMDPGTLWREVLFDDSPWNSGPAQLGFGDGDEATMLTPGITTAYFRGRFDYNIPGVTSLTLRLLRDDGAVVYINGVEVYRNNMPSGPISYSTLATASVGGAQESTEFVTAQIDPSVLAAGWNVVAVEVHQVTVSSGDLSFDLELIADYGPEPAVVTVTAADAEAAELSPLVDAPLNPGVFRIARTGATTEALEIVYRLSGTASNGADYVRLSGSAEIPAGASTVDVIVDVVYDNIVEGDETVVLRLLPPMCPMTLPPPPGCYRVGTNDSATVTIHDVSQPPPNTGPYVQLNEPQNGEVFTAPTNIVLRAYAQDREDGNDLRVEFFSGDQSLGFGTFVPTLCPAPYCPYYQLTWSNVPPGSYVLIARATDSKGVSSNSAPVNISVHESMPPVGAARDDQESPAVASDGVNFFVVWMDRRNHNYDSGGNDYDIYGTRVSPTGEVLDRNGIAVCTASRAQMYPSVAFDGQNYLVVWSDNRDNVNGILSNEIYGARVTPAGAVLEPNGFKITHGEVAHVPVIAFNGTDYLVAAYAYDHNGVRGSTVLGVRVRPAGEVRDTEELILQQSNFPPMQPVAVASIAGEWLVVWNSHNATVDGVRVSAAGTVSSPMRLLENGETWWRGLAAAGPNYFLTSIASRQVASDTYVVDVFGTWISREGQPFRTAMVSSNRNYSVGSGSGQPTSYFQNHATAAAQGSNVVVIWDAGTIYTNGGVYNFRSDIRGARAFLSGFVSPSFPICTAPQEQSFPAIAFNGQQYLAAWQDARSAPPEEYLPLRHFDIYGARVVPFGETNGFLISTAISNRPPHVQINTPSTGDVFMAPAEITLHAYAQDPEDSYYVSVEFFADGEGLGSGTFVPTRCAIPYCPYFALTWSNVPPGEYTLHARATDRAGDSTLSEPVMVTVRERIPEDRELHVVGIYSGTVDGGTSRNHEEGRTALVVDRPGKLVTLFLSAYEPVRWSITASAGTVIEKVYVSGYYPPTVEGVNADRVFVVSYGYSTGYSLDSGRFYRIAPSIRQLTGLEIASFHGSYQGPYPTPMLIDAVQDDPRLHSSYPVPTPLSELPNIRFSISFHAGIGIYSRAYTLAGPNDGGRLLLGDDRAVADNRGKYYAIGDSGLMQIDPATGAVRAIPSDPNLPEMSIITGIAYDSLRDRVLLVTLGGEGFLYAYSPSEERWSVLSSMRNVDIASLVYHAAGDALYGIGVRYPDYGNMTLYRLNADGTRAGEIELALYPWGVDMSSAELVSEGEHLVLLVRPSYVSDPFRTQGDSRMYLIDPRNGQWWLTYRSNLPRPSDTDQDGVPDDRDHCPGTAPDAIVDANGCSADQRDSDYDGVPDGRDECPDSPPGTVVDTRGCALPLCPGRVEWEVALNGLANSFNQVRQTPDGGLVLGGTWSGSRSLDYRVVRMDAAGHILWDKIFYVSDHDHLTDLQLTSDGGFILGGESFSPADGEKTSPGYGNADYWVLRLDADGNKLWDRSYGGTSWDALFGLEETADGGFILGGMSASEPGGSKTSSNFGLADFWLVRIDADGNQLWDRTYGGSSIERWGKARETVDGGFVLFGASASGPNGNKTTQGLGGEDGWIVRTDASGNKLWEQTYGSGRNDFFQQMVETADGGFVVAGWTEASGRADAWALRLNADGSKRWEQIFGGSGDEQFATVAATGTDRYVLGGMMDQVSWLVRIDGAGNKLWERTVRAASDGITSVQPTFDGGLAVATEFVRVIKLGPESTVCDADGDGVPDKRDECPDTGGGPVNARGCSLAQLCPCEGSWRNHAEYVTCVIRHAWEFFRERLITADERRNVIRAAVDSSCGRRPDRREPLCVHLLPLTREECQRDGVQFVLSGDAYGSCVLECSSDLVNWAPVPNSSVAIDGWEISCPVESGVKARFYRLRTTE
jgi:hypothetical protein